MGRLYQVRERIVHGSLRCRPDLVNLKPDHDRVRRELECLVLETECLRVGKKRNYETTVFVCKEKRGIKTLFQDITIFQYLKFSTFPKIERRLSHKGFTPTRSLTRPRELFLSLRVWVWVYQIKPRKSFVVPNKNICWSKIFVTNLRRKVAFILTRLSPSLTQKRGDIEGKDYDVWVSSFCINRVSFMDNFTFTLVSCGSRNE